MATNNITDCSKCEFFGTSCITGLVPGSPKENGMLPKPKPTVTSCQIPDICEYTYGCYIKQSEGEILTREVKVKFVDGEPIFLEAVYIWKNTSDFDRFMRFANSYAKTNGLGYSEKK